MLFDTDVLIWVQRGNTNAATIIDEAENRQLSIQSYMELLQGAKSKAQHRFVKDFLKDFSFEVLPLTQNIGHRAAIYVEEYSLSHGVRAGDAIVAATAVENDLELHTGNQKHFQCIKDLQLSVFKP